MGGFPGMGGFGSGLRNSSDDQVAGNLVEIGLYGITSLYEKFQPEGAKKEDGTVAAPTGPATGALTNPAAPAAGTPSDPTAATDPTKK
jgi:hypothetical protein